MDIGNKIKEYRKKINLTQKELAKKINKSERMVQKYESNDVIPSIEVLDKIAEALNTNVKEMIGFNKSEKIADKERIPLWPIFAEDKSKLKNSFINDEFMQKYKIEFLHLDSIFEAFGNSEKLISLFFTIIKNIEKLLEDMKLESALLNLHFDDPKDYYRDINFSKYDYLQMCLKTSSVDKIKILENLEKLQLLFFELKYDKQLNEINSIIKGDNNPS